MKTNKIFAAVLVFLLAACKKENQTHRDDPAVPTARESVILDYNTNYLGSELANCGWTGNTASCDPGTVPQSTHDKVIQRINYFRRLVGLNDNTTLDASQFEKYQKTALMMKVNGLDHFPPKTWKCWTQEGSDGAATSNLGLGSHSSSAVTQCIEDPGSYNFDVGHRRWVLHSAKTQFSYGTTDGSMALGTIGVAGGNTKIPSYIAYPPNGYMPQQLVFPRWSFGIPKADFSYATVTMTGPNGKIPVTIVSTSAVVYGDNTIVWEPQGIITDSDTDVQYTVFITGIESASQASYTYTVTLVKP